MAELCLTAVTVEGCEYSALLPGKCKCTSNIEMAEKCNCQSVIYYVRHVTWIHGCQEAWLYRGLFLLSVVLCCNNACDNAVTLPQFLYQSVICWPVSFAYFSCVHASVTLLIHTDLKQALIKEHIPKFFSMLTDLSTILWSWACVLNALCNHCLSCSCAKQK